MIQIDNQKDFINTSTDQNIQVIKSTKSQPNPIIPIANKEKPLSKKESRQQNKKNKSTVNKTNNIPIVDISGMNKNIENTEVQINRESEKINNQATDLGIFFQP